VNTVRPSVSLDDQVRWAEGAAARTKNYWAKLLRDGKANPVTARLEVDRADAVVETLKKLLQGGFRAVD
jgi:hypothetical protein